MNLRSFGEKVRNDAGVVTVSVAREVALNYADGRSRISLVDVMFRSGLTHGGFYAHFTSNHIANSITQVSDEYAAVVLN